jgi:4-hydroxy-tetrahydrodipicolinate synthase
MSAVPPRGILAPVVTPFKGDESVDYSAWQRHLEFLIAGGVQGLVILAGEGEFYALTPEERRVAVRFCTQTVARRLPLCANVGAMTTSETVRLAVKAEEDGVDFVVVVPPYFGGLSEDELVEHFSEVCSSLGTPVLACNEPVATGVELTPDMLRRVAQASGNFIGVLDSGGRLDFIPEWRRAGLCVYAGASHLLLDALRLGAAGLLNACANFAPRLLLDLYRAFETGDLGQAARLQGLLDPLREALAGGSCPAVVKELMGLAGMGLGRTRRPAGPVAGKPRAALASMIEALAGAGYMSEGRPRPSRS